MSLSAAARIGRGADAAVPRRPPRGRHASALPPKLAEPRDVALLVTAVLGALTVGWLAFSWLTGWQLTVFLTGSMTPTMPTGALAVIAPEPAAELRVGDVVQVPRQHDGRPVTHRIVAIDPGPTPEERSLTLKGDANATADAEPYLVTGAGRVVWSAPYLGAWLDRLKSPNGTAVLSILVAGVISWALWPAGASRPAPAGPVYTPRFAAPGRPVRGTFFVRRHKPMYAAPRPGRAGRRGRPARGDRP